MFFSLLKFTVVLPGHERESLMQYQDSTFEDSAFTPFLNIFTNYKDPYSIWLFLLPWTPSSRWFQATAELKCSLIG